MTDTPDDLIQKLTSATNEIYKSCQEGPCRVLSPYELEALKLYQQVSDAIGGYHPRDKVSSDRRDALCSVLYERFKQDGKWGKQDHNFPVWLAILTEELGELSKEWLERNFDALKLPSPNFRTEMVQVVAVALAMLECGDRNNWWGEARGS